MIETTVESVTSEKPGFYRDVDFDTYAAWEGVNSAILNGLSRTPAHLRYQLSTGGKQRTRALDLGWLLHVAMLEPEHFKKNVVVPPALNRKTRPGKAAWAQFEAQHPGAHIIDKDTHAKVLSMTHSLRNHETARQFFSSRGHNEVSILWDEDGVRCKARIDRVGMLNEWPLVGDLKTARDASRRAFERFIHAYGYHIQAAHYLAGLQTLAPIATGDPFRRFVFFVVESEPPYPVAVYELDDAAVEEGALQRSRYLHTYKKCVETGHWPGYAPGVDSVSLPAWAFKNFVQD